MRRAMDKLFEDVMLVQSSFPFRWSEGPKHTLHRCSYRGRKLPQQTGHCLPKQQWKSSPVKNGKKAVSSFKGLRKKGLNLASNVVNILFFTGYIIKLYSEINCGLWPTVTSPFWTADCESPDQHKKKNSDPQTIRLITMNLNFAVVHEIHVRFYSFKGT